MRIYGLSRREEIDIAPISLNGINVSRDGGPSQAVNAVQAGLIPPLCSIDGRDSVLKQ